MPVARRILCNPADKTKRYILYSNGFIEAIGGALPIAMDEAVLASPPSPSAPLWADGVSEPAVSFQVINWATPSGYTLDMWGHVWPWGGISGVAGAAQPNTGGPNYLFGTGGAAFQSAQYGYVIDFQMDPAGGGTGYLLLYNGDVIAIGTGVTSVQHNPAIPDTAARMLQMDWSSKRYWILDNLGRVSAYNGGTPQPPVVSVEGISLTYPGTFWGRGGTYGKGGFRLYDKAAAPKGWVIDAYGTVYRVNAAQDAFGFPRTPNAAQWVDIEIVDDGTGVNPLRLVALSAQGKQKEWVVSTAPVGVVIEPVGAITTQNLPWVGWQYIDREGDGQAAYEAKIITSAVYSSGGTNEVQSTDVTGSPTGGTVKLGFRVDAQAPDAVTADIARNANAATVQAALEALPNIGSGNVVCAGGPWGTAPITVTFQGAMSAWNWPQLTLAQNALTGGSSPTVAISTTTPGVGIDPAVATNVFSDSGGSVVAPDTTTRVRPTAALVNSTTYRAYVRVTDTSGKVSGWTFKQFNIAITALNAPTVTPSVLGGVSGTSLEVSAATGAGLPGTARFLVQFSDDAGSSWKTVRSGEALVPDGSGDATVVDLEAPFGVQRSYRAVTYVYDAAADAWNQSAWSSTANATLTPKSVWALTNPYNPSQDLVVKVQPDFESDAQTIGETMFLVNRDDPVVLTDGAPKLPSFRLGLWALDRATRLAIEALVASDQVLLLRDPFGRTFYVKVSGSFREKMIHARPLAAETTVIRDANEITIEVQQVKRPMAGLTVGPLVEV